MKSKLKIIKTIIGLILCICGKHTIVWDVESLPDGYYRLKVFECKYCGKVGDK